MNPITICYLRRCRKGPFEDKDPCHDCHDVSCMYHQGFSEEDELDRLEVYFDPEKKKFYGKMNGKKVKISTLSFDSRGLVDKAYVSGVD